MGEPAEEAFYEKATVYRILYSILYCTVCQYIKFGRLHTKARGHQHPSVSSPLDLPLPHGVTLPTETLGWRK